MIPIIDHTSELASTVFGVRVFLFPFDRVNIRMVYIFFFGRTFSKYVELCGCVHVLGFFTSIHKSFLRRILSFC